MDDRPEVLPPSVLKAFRQTVATCQSCLALSDYLEKIGMPDVESRDRASHVLVTTQAALELDRLARQEVR